MAEVTEPRIVQIMPADGWLARWPGMPPSEDAPIIGWALVERDDGSRYVTGLYAMTYMVAMVGWFEGEPDSELPRYLRGDE